eukprot:c54478_g1_i1 orf=191-466(+)
MRKEMVQSPVEGEGMGKLGRWNSYDCELHGKADWSCGGSERRFKHRMGVAKNSSPINIEAADHVDGGIEHCVLPLRYRLRCLLLLGAQDSP